LQLSKEETAGEELRKRRSPRERGHPGTNYTENEREHAGGRRMKEKANGKNKLTGGHRINLRPAKGPKVDGQA